MTELRFFNPYGEIRHTENRLPHWQQEGAVISSLSDWPMRCRLGCVINGSMIVSRGYASIPSRGRPRLSANITTDSLLKSNAGWTPDPERASYASQSAQRSSLKRSGILKTSAL